MVKNGLSNIKCFHTFEWKYLVCFTSVVDWTIVADDFFSRPSFFIFFFSYYFIEYFSWPLKLFAPALYSTVLAYRKYRLSRLIKYNSMNIFQRKNCLAYILAYFRAYIILFAHAYFNTFFRLRVYVLYYYSEFMGREPTLL